MRTPGELPLSRGEWSLLLDCLNNLGHFEDLSAFPEDARLGMTRRAQIITEAADGIEVEHLDIKHRIEGKALLEKLDALADEDFEMIWDVAYGFWQDPDNGVIPGKAETR